MSSSHLVTRPRMIHVSTFKATGKASVLSTSVLTGPPLTLTHRRNFWWSPSGYRTRSGTSSSSSKIDYYDHLDNRRQKSTKYGCLGLLRPRSFVRSDTGWRHGASRDGLVDEFSSSKKWEDDRETIEKHGDKWDKQLQSTQEELTRQFETYRRRLDEDPFRAIFGRTLENGVFNPWKFMARNFDVKNGTKNSKTPTTTPSFDKQLEREPRENNDSRPLSPKTDKSRRANETIPSTPFSNSQISSEPLQEYDIDPISLKKVPRKPTVVQSAPEDSTNSALEDIETPAKASAQSVLHEIHLRMPEAIAFPRRINIALRYSGHIKKPEFDQMKSEIISSVVRSQFPKLETSLDRQIRTRDLECQAGTKSPRPLDYKAIENKTEDIDLLRASDVRASSGLAGKIKLESRREKLERRDKLDLLFSILDLETQAIGVQLNIEMLADKVTSKLKNMLAEKEQKRKMAAKQSLAKEIQSQKAVMEAIEQHGRYPLSQSENLSILPGEGDMSANVHEFASRDRWYKKKAPHAADQKCQNPERRQQQDKDRELVRELRSIYEDFYGTIDTKHRQNTGNSTVQQSKDTIRQGPGEEFSNRSIEALNPLLSVQPAEYVRSSCRSGKAPNQLQQLEHRNKDSGREYWARKLGEEQQKLHEDLHETKDLIRLVLTQLSKLADSSRLCLQEPQESQESRKTEAVSTTDQKQANRDAVVYQNQPPVITSSTPPPPKKTATPSPRIYKVLAYNHLTNKVTIANLTSTNPAFYETPQPISRILPRLSNPAPFVAYFPSLRSSGYEIVSGRGDVLVFKKVRGTELSARGHRAPSRSKLENSRPVNPIDGTTTQTGNFASPTGFVNHDVVYPLPPEDASSPWPSSGFSSGEKVRREEDVFSGSHRAQWRGGERAGREPRQEGRARKMGRRVFWVGIWTAGCCYAAGVVTEFFRTGGSTGLGPEGF